MPLGIWLEQASGLFTPFPLSPWFALGVMQSGGAGRPPLSQGWGNYQGTASAREPSRSVGRHGWKAEGRVAPQVNGGAAGDGAARPPGV